ncbi:MAG TPA: PVC-type heme-binding CxxCH protein, partial [Gemmataceae bacterium]|nr:PVC-type heme-binding CxxCH protein [Gemmataceae bacterium]
ARPTLQVAETKTVPAGPPEIVLDGWSLKAVHNVFNSLTWGPDGWLYGCNGIIATSRIGRPGTPDKDRTPMNCGVWRYHPTKKKFEVVAHGTTNPWGLDFDEHGEMFITNCVIDHLWHVVPGGHYQRMYGEDLTPNVYKLMPSICDHLHWGGGSWTSSRAPSSTGKKDDAAYKVHSDAGGGHAHVGCMIYLGDNWPARYRNGVFMCNLHGNRINHDILERNGSTYVARHGKDFMHANDPWFRGIALGYGPDGGVYVSDWTDTGECHNYKVADKTNGRIFKITYGDVKPWKGDLAKLSDLELVRLQDGLNRNEWTVRHSRRLLQERCAMRKLDADAIASLEKMLTHYGTLGALQVLYASKNLDQAKMQSIAENAIHESTRSWAIRLYMDNDEWKDKSAFLSHIARTDPSPLVRLHLASICQRLNPGTGQQAIARYHVGAQLAYHAEDANDPYLPFMNWYAMAPIVRTRAILTNELHLQKVPLVRQFIARRGTEEFLSGSEEGENLFRTLVDGMGNRATAPYCRDVLRGIHDGLAGRRQLKMPEEWKRVYPTLIESPLPEVRERALALAVQFGDERAFALLRKLVPDRAASLKEREDALKTLLFQQKADLVPMLHQLLEDSDLRRPAIRGLAAFEDPQTPTSLLKGYPKWNVDEKSDVIQTLSARGKFALALLDAVDAKTIPRGDINSYTIRQLQALKSPEVSAKLTKVIGEIRPASAEKAKLMAKFKAELKPNVLKQANLANGRALYVKACANCHRLFGEGGSIGPDLTGSQRINLDYILENVLDPSAIVPREYQVTVVETKAGRTLSGIVKMETPAAITLQLQNEVVVVPKGDIETRTATKQSMMPDGIFEPMRLEDVRDLVAYLASPTQVALKK